MAPAIRHVLLKTEHEESKKTYQPVPVRAMATTPSPQIIQADICDFYYEPFRLWTPDFPIAINYEESMTLLGPNSVTLTCPMCQEKVETIVKSKPTSRTHMFAMMMCMFLLWPCCLIPYCLRKCKGRDHSCPNCGAFLGTFEN